MATDISNINLYLTINNDGTGSVSATTPEPEPQYILSSTVYITSYTTSVNNFGIIIYHNNNNTWEQIAKFMGTDGKQSPISNNVGTPVEWTLNEQASSITTSHEISNVAGLDYRIAIIYKYSTEGTYRSCYMPVSGRKLLNWSSYNTASVDIGVTASETGVVIETGNEGQANV